MAAKSADASKPTLLPEPPTRQNAHEETEPEQDPEAAERSDSHSSHPEGVHTGRMPATDCRFHGASETIVDRGYGWDGGVVEYSQVVFGVRVPERINQLGV